ncbi:hypothetical protein FGO68_gene3714 [Halteria grandinella]|uniref:Uncharacterized protein n=1 Tax=Halteria grandinella TaxID=5974 RepID=A0A8J8NQX2_HALGN|nr:hypothetical protein FGO68_gene3714 [Halteria grandinella]
MRKIAIIEYYQFYSNFLKRMATTTTSSPGSADQPIALAPYSFTTKSSLEVFKRKYCPSSYNEKLGNNITNSYSFSIILSYIGTQEGVKLQQLSRFFYKVQLPRGLNPTFELNYEKVRLLHLNKNKITIYQLKTMTKEERILLENPQYVFTQSIEVRRYIYLTATKIVNGLPNHKLFFRLNEKNWSLEQLKDMSFGRVGHGMISWRDRYIIVVGSQFNDESSRTCEMYDIFKGEWIMLPTMNNTSVSKRNLITNGRFLYKFTFSYQVGWLEIFDLQAFMEEKQAQLSEPIIVSVKWITINVEKQIRSLLQIGSTIHHQLLQEQLLIFSNDSYQAQYPYLYDIESKQLSRFHQEIGIFGAYYSNQDVHLLDGTLFIMIKNQEEVKIYKYFLNRTRNQDEMVIYCTAEKIHDYKKRNQIITTQYGFYKFQLSKIIEAVFTTKI